MSDDQEDPLAAPQRPQDSSAALRADGGATMADGRSPDRKAPPASRRDTPDATGCDRDVTPNEGFGAPGSVAEQRTGRDENPPFDEDR